LYLTNANPRESPVLQQETQAQPKKRFEIQPPTGGESDNGVHLRSRGM